jgi:hypothetical protein
LLGPALPAVPGAEKRFPERPGDVLPAQLAHRLPVRPTAAAVAGAGHDQPAGGIDKLKARAANVLEPPLGLQVLHRGVDLVLDELRLERQGGGRS